MRLILGIVQALFGSVTCPACSSTRVQTSHGGKICTCQECGHEWER